MCTPTIDELLVAWSLSARQFAAKVAPAVSDRTGIIRRVAVFASEPGEPRVFHAECRLANTDYLCGDSASCLPATTGAGLTEDLALACALGEGVERYCASVYDPASFLLASYEELRRWRLHAVAPRDFALYSPSQYSREGFMPRAFTEDLKVSWTCGCSLTTGRDTYVPASLVYVPYRYESKANLLCFPNTSGLCCSSSLAEAILGGVCEVIERDASMCCWMNQLPSPPLRAESTSWLAATLADRICGCDFDLRLHDITTDIRVPTVLAMLVDQAHEGVAVAVGTATRLTLEQAVLKAVLEAAQVRRWLKQNNARSRPAVQDDFSDVRDFDDHMRLFGRRESLRYIDFLSSVRVEKSVATEDPPYMRDVTSQLRHCLDVVMELGLDVIVVDVTQPDIASLGVHVVKVLIPGLTNINADHNYPLLGGSRLYSVPRLLGYRDADRTEAELNHVPHPFP
jgi:ribosomal protein S12 methylthiotransferase accessory factor